MDPLSIAGSVAGLISLSDTIFRKLYHYVKDVKSAEKSVKDLKNEVAALNGVLHNLRLVAEDLEADNRTPASVRLDHVKDCLALLYDLDEKLKNIGLTEKGRLRNTIQKLAWPFKAVDAKTFIEEIRQHRNTLNLAVSADTLTVLLKSLSKQEDMLTKIAEVNTKLCDKVEIDTRIQLDKERQQILDDFLLVDPSKNFRTKWLARSGSHIWFGGIPGAGKTVLSGLIIQECLAMSTSDRAVAFFYCDYKNKETHDIRNILSTLASQLARQNTDSFQLLKNYHEKLRPSNHLKKEPEQDELIKLIHAMSDTFEDVRIIVDGVDECGNSAGEVSRELRLMASQHDTMSLGLLSRDEQDIRDELDDSFCDYIEISAHTKDLEHYVRCEIEDRMAKRRLKVKSIDLKDEIIKQLVSRANGMFRWVSCQLDELCDLPTDAMRRKALTQLPKTLYETYDRILMRINQQAKPMVRRTLQWIAYATPKPSVDQLVEIVSFGEDDEDLNPEAYPDPEDLLRSCGSLIRRVHQSLELAHFTVQEFLEAIDPEDSNLGQFRLDSVSDAVALARACTQYLGFPVFNRFPSLDDDGEIILDTDHPFYKYACTQLTRFEGFYDPDMRLQKRLRHLFQPQKTHNFKNFMIFNFSHFIWLFNTRLDVLRRITSNDFTPLHAAAMLHLRDLCQWLISQGCDINLISYFGGPLECALYGTVGAFSTALSYSFNHFTEEKQLTLRLLMDSGADCTQESVRNFSMSFAAASLSFNGDHGLLTAMMRRGLRLEMDAIRVIKHLKSASPQAIGDLISMIDEFPPTIISAEVRLELVEIYKETEAVLDPSLPSAQEMSDTVFGKALEFTVRYDQLSALKDLSTDERFHVDREYSDEDGGTLLHLAIIHDSIEVTNFLLDFGFDPAKTDDDGFTVLQVAAERGLKDDQILRRLIASSAVGIANHEGRTVWHEAAKRGHCNILELLLEEYGPYKPWLHTSSKSNTTPLLEAVKAGNSDCALLLLDAEDIEEQILGNRLLQYAVESGMPDLLEKLIHRGANPKSWMKNGQNLLYFLTASVEPRLLDILLGSGLDSNSLDPINRSPLTAFLASGRMVSSDNETVADTTVIRKLATAEAVSARDRQGNTAWSYFCTRLVPAILIINEIAESSYLMDVFTILSQAGALEFWEKTEIVPGMAYLSKSCLDHVPEIRSYIGPTRNRCDGPFVETAEFLHDAISYSHKASTLVAHSYFTDLLVWSVFVSQKKLICKLVSLGVSVHEQSDILYKCNAIDACCLQDTGLDDLKLVLGYADKKRLRPLVKVEYPPLHYLFYPLDETGIGRYQMEKLELLLISGADPNTKSLTDSTAAYWAIECQNLQALKVLVQFGADLFRRDQFGWSVIHSAVYYGGNIELLRYLRDKIPSDEIWMETVAANLPHGPLFLPKYFGCGLSHLAAYHGDPDILQFLEENGCLQELEAQTNEGIQPIHFAVCSNNTEATRWLIERGVNINATFGTQQFTALHVACHQGFLENVMTLVEAGAAFQPDRDGETPEIKTYPAMRAELLQRLPRCGVPIPPSVLENLQQDYEAQFTQGFHNAIETGNMKVCRSIARDISKLNSVLPDCSSCTPLIVALAAGQTEVVELFLKHGANTHGVPCRTIKDLHPEFRTTLSIAVTQPKLNKHLGGLLDLNLRSERHRSRTKEYSDILHTAAAENGDAVKIILEHIETHQGLLSEVGKARSRHRSSGIFKSQLIEAQDTIDFCEGIFRGKGGTALHVAAICNNMVGIEELIAQGANVDSQDINGETPLMWAIRSENVDIVKMLLKNGASPRAMTRSLLSPLMIACDVGAADLASLLMGQHADQQLRDLHGGTALHHAAHTKGLGIFISMVEAGWNPYEPDTTRRSPIYYALLEPASASYIYAAGFQLDHLIPRTTYFPIPFSRGNESHIMPTWFRSYFELVQLETSAMAVTVQRSTSHVWLGRMRLLSRWYAMVQN
ncbi:ankyrin [Periconia macrospinosa]|uniref:Ankyrin n=1 Tax=Periconia macrospinosa TaxID=97972 RepID=A0A2V1D9X0_9PLEO|nr:ankyrin [Periconia macrospinosa]